ncbi:MAG: sugar ABC transporter permease [Eubacteriales bacterium]|jgi:multiple sugar transport system permease protein
MAKMHLINSKSISIFKIRGQVLLFLLPAFTAIIFVMAYPLIKGMDISFTNRLLTYDKYSYIGIQNFLAMFSDKFFWYSLGNSIKLTFLAVAGTLLLGFGLAVLLNHQFVFRDIFRGALFIPWVMPSMVTALMFRWLYNDFYGYVNYMLTKYHLIAQPVNLLADPQLAWTGVLLPIIWCNYPFVMLVFLAALQSIDKNLYEAAHIDGANRLQAFWFITFPGLIPAFVIVIILEIIWTFASFDLVFLLTRGGPADSTLTLSLYIYKQAFEAKLLGYASALGAALFLILFIVTMMYFSFVRRTGVYEK